MESDWHTLLAVLLVHPQDIHAHVSPLALTAAVLPVPVVLNNKNSRAPAHLSVTLVHTNRGTAPLSFHSSPTKIRLSLLALAMTGSVG